MVALIQVRRALKPDGTMLVIDIAAGETLEDNLAHPLAPLFFGTSQMICLSSSMSEEGGAGLGTLGLSPSRLRALTEAHHNARQIERLTGVPLEVRP